MFSSTMQVQCRLLKLTMSLLSDFPPPFIHHPTAATTLDDVDVFALAIGYQGILLDYFEHLYVAHRS